MKAKEAGLMKAKEAHLLSKKTIHDKMAMIFSKIKAAAIDGEFFCFHELDDYQLDILQGLGYSVEGLPDNSYRCRISWRYTA